MQKSSEREDRKGAILVDTVTCVPLGLISMSFSKRRLLIEQIVDSKGIKSVDSYSVPTASVAVVPAIALFNWGKYATPLQGGTCLTRYVRPLSQIYILLLHGRGLTLAVLEWRRM
jgi:hypothetical protein